MGTRHLDIRLLPVHGGAYTRLQLCVFVPTPMPTWALKRLCDLLALFSGESIQFVLSVDIQAAPWSELWVDSIIRLPSRHSKTRFIIRRRNKHGGPARSQD
jgi:hypothetical protein